jgi:hypothetical protein
MRKSTDMQVQAYAVGDALRDEHSSSRPYRPEAHIHQTPAWVPTSRVSDVDEPKPGICSPETEQRPPGNHKNLPDRSTQIAILKSGLTKTRCHGVTTPWLLSFVSPLAGRI